MKSSEAAAPVLPGAYRAAEADATEAVKPGRTGAAPAGAVHGAMFGIVEKVLARASAQTKVLLLTSFGENSSPSKVLHGFSEALGVVTDKSVLAIRLENASSGEETITEWLQRSGGSPQASRRGAVETVFAGATPSEKDKVKLIGQLRDLLPVARSRDYWIVLEAPAFESPEQWAPLIARVDAVLTTAQKGKTQANQIVALSTLCSQLKKNFLGVILV